MVISNFIYPKFFKRKWRPPTRASWRALSKAKRP